MRLVVAVFLLVFGCTAGGAQEWRNWQSEHYRDHPLVGHTYLPSDGDITRRCQSEEQRQACLFRFLTLKIAIGPKFLLIGEQHDNPDHHSIQAWFIKQIANSKRFHAVIFEMVPRSYARQIRQFDLTTDPNLDKFAERLDWEKRGWPSWEMYRPIAQAAARYRFPMIAGDLDRKMVSRIHGKGLKALSKRQIVAFGLDQKLPNAHQASLDAELRSSHCNLLPDSAIPAMRIVQRARDGSLADAMIDVGPQYDVILIAGNGHIRKDRGVPLVLRRRLPGYVEKKRKKSGGGIITARIYHARSLSIGLIEVEPGLNDPADYNLINEQGEPLYDAVIFTPKANITDHCAALRKQFEKKKSE